MNGSARRRLLSCGIMLVATFSVSDLAYAQDDGAAPSETGDIVVTARRRAENLQDIPVSVTAITGDLLKEQRITRADDIQALSPSLTVTSRTGQRQSGSFTIRGQGQSFGGALPSVITYFSEVPLDSNGGSAFALYDLDSVQVLRGPQGTLFGRNTNGGAVLLAPVRPKDEFEGFFTASAGNLSYREFTGAINVPITSTLAVRLAGNIKRRDGYVHNLANGKDYEDQHSQSWRASLRWTPTDTITNDLVYNGLTADENGSAYILSVLRPGSRTALFNGGTAVGQLAAQRQRGPRVIFNSQPYLGAKREIHLVVNTTALELADKLQLKNIASYERVKVDYGTDLDGIESRSTLTTSFKNALADVLKLPYGSDTNLNQLTEELQLSGEAFHGNLNFIVGGFFLDLRTPGGLDKFSIYRTSYSPTGPNSVNINVSTNQVHDQSKAVFGQVTLKLDGLIDGLSATGGLRYTWDKRQTSNGQLTSSAGTSTETIVPASTYRCLLPGVGPAAGVAPDRCFRLLSGKYDDYGYNFSLDLKAAHGVLFYAATRRGFKDGGFNNLTVTANDPAYAPETVTDYEIGVKTTFRSGNISGRFNVDGFVSNYSDIQRQITGGNPVTATIVNAAKGKIKGIEVEGTISAGPVSLSGFYSYLKTSYVGFIDRGIDVSSAAFLGVPKHSGGITLRGEQELANDLGTLSAQVNAYLTTRVALDANTVFHYEGFAEGYTLLNGRIDLADIRGSGVTVSAWARNLTNRLYKSGGVPQGGTNGNTSFLYGEPRTYGLELNFAF